MKLVLVRHGESTANLAGLLSSLPSDEVRLTDRGRSQVEVAASRIRRGRVDCVYVSPLLRTLETADILLRDWPKTPKKKIDARISEINYGKYSGKPNNSQLDAIRKSQLAGDYLTRFGDSGENKLEILSRLYDFLIEVIAAHSGSARIVVVSHGSIISWLEKIIRALGEADSLRHHMHHAEVRAYTLYKRDIKKLHRHRLSITVQITNDKDKRVIQKTSESFPDAKSQSASSKS